MSNWAIERLKEIFTHQSQNHAIAKSVNLTLGGESNMGNLIQDLRYGARMLAKSPGFTAVAVLTLALGVGANTAIFSVVYSVLLRPLPYRQPGKLVTLAEGRGKQATPETNSSYPDYLDWTRQAQSFDSLAAYTPNGFTFSGNVAPETVQAGSVTSNFFSTLGVKPALGRDFVAGEDQPKSGKVVILSHKFWAERFAADPSAIGRAIRLDRESYTIIGVLPKDFEFAPTNSPPVWVPIDTSQEYTRRRNLRWLNVIGRVRGDKSFAQALSEMEGITARLDSAYPQEDGEVTIIMGALRDQIVGKARPLLWTLFGAVTFVLLIACANVAGLLLARGISRKREIAIRLAMGAGRRRLIRQLMTESLLLSLAGGAVGLLGSQWFVALMIQAIPKALLDKMPYLNSVKADPTVLAFVFVVAVATGIVFGVVPAFESSRSNVNRTLKEQTRSSEGRGFRSVRDAFVVAEIALALVLLVGAGLMLKSMKALLNADPGFRTDHLLTFAVFLPPTSYKDDASTYRFEESFSDALRNLPGVEGVGITSMLPLTGGGNTVRYVVEGRPVAQGAEDEVSIRDISQGYFDVMKIPLQKGRFFAPTDKMGAPGKLIVNQAFAKRVFPGEDAVGKRIKFTYSPTNPFLEIVGVVGDENTNQLDSPMTPTLYASFEQGPDSFYNYVIRTASRPEDMMSPIRNLLHSADAEMPMIQPQTMDQIISESPAVFLRRYPSYLLGSFAALAVALAMVGLYGLIAFTVAQRTPEIGIRMALGAQVQDVLRLVLRHGMRLAALGVVCGIVGALAMTRLITSLLYGVSPADPATYVAVAGLLGIVALAASYIPARRAARVDPMVALRYE
jgi:macrolide transport system ATP-binding/permease protein